MKNTTTSSPIIKQTEIFIFLKPHHLKLSPAVLGVSLLLTFYTVFAAVQEACFAIALSVNTIGTDALGYDIFGRGFCAFVGQFKVGFRVSLNNYGRDMVKGIPTKIYRII